MNFINQDINLVQIDECRQAGLRPVAVACIIFNNKILMVYKKKYNLWQLPQGGIKNKELPRDALRREIKEELGKSFSLFEDDFFYLGEGKIFFPFKKQGVRNLQTDEGEAVYMKGKKYFFYLVKAVKPEINLAETEFDGYQWVNYEQAKKSAENIYQKGKKRITLKVLNLLKNNSYIN
ncbi:MAG TPA: NUDIX hydrolase [Candidatus Uhrbacteria bacterium]|nr:NUDIX hydrolase [Candidatus Uhrbacteria bacterium]